MYLKFVFRGVQVAEMCTPTAKHRQDLIKLLVVVRSLFRLFGGNLSHIPYTSSVYCLVLPKTCTPTA